MAQLAEADLPAGGGGGRPHGARPDDLRHAFASLLIHEGRLSVVDIAAQLGHNPTVCLDTYAHVMAEQRGAEPVGAAEQIATARRDAGLRADHATGEQLSFVNLDWLEEPLASSGIT